MQFNCPHCNNAISLTVEGVDKGVDVFGFPADEKFTPIDTANWKKKGKTGPWRKAFIPAKGEYEIKMPDGSVKTFVSDGNTTIMKAYHLDDNSLSDLFKKQFPRISCGERD